MNSSHEVISAIVGAVRGWSELWAVPVWGVAEINNINWRFNETTNNYGCDHWHSYYKFFSWQLQREDRVLIDFLKEQNKDLQDVKSIVF